MRQLFEQRNILGVATAVILLFTLILAKNTLAMPPSAVSLASFTITSQQNAALIEWETATELSAAGFAIERKAATDGDDQFADISGFINAIGDVTIGAEYSYLDETAVNGQTYVYRLMEYEASNSTINELERVQITIGVQPTATPITASGGNTATPRATAIPSASATPRATATATATPVAEKTAVSPTTFPTVTPTTTTGNTTNPTATAVSPTATAVSPTATRQNDNQDRSNGGTDIAFAQEETPLPTTAAYPAETTTDKPADSNDYPPADTGQSLAQETTTPYPIVIESSPDGDNGNNGVNVIGSGASDNNNGAVDAVEDDNGNSYLWIGFIAALLIFITGMIGTAVLFVRKK